MDRYRSSNRELWNEWTAVHVESQMYDVAGFLDGLPNRFGEGGSRLRNYELDEIGDVSDKGLLHLQCHFGMDTLAWAARGADVVGADFSEKSITVARDLATRLGLSAEFVCCDVFDLPARLHREFDVVYTSRGVLSWLPNLRHWAEVVRHFLARGGFLYVTDVHPFGQMFDEAAEDLRVKFPYFGSRPIAFEPEGSYADPNAEVRDVRGYNWPHGFGEIVTAIAEAGLVIEFVHDLPFYEWPKTFLEKGSDGTWRRPIDEIEIPLMFSLRARRP